MSAMARANEAWPCRLYMMANLESTRANRVWPRGFGGLRSRSGHKGAWSSRAVSQRGWAGCESASLQTCISRPEIGNCSIVGVRRQQLIRRQTGKRCINPAMVLRHDSSSTAIHPNELQLPIIHCRYGFRLISSHSNKMQPPATRGRLHCRNEGIMIAPGMIGFEVQIAP